MTTLTALPKWKPKLLLAKSGLADRIRLALKHYQGYEPKNYSPDRRRLDNSFIEKGIGLSYEIEEAHRICYEKGMRGFTIGKIHLRKAACSVMKAACGEEKEEKLLGYIQGIRKILKDVKSGVADKTGLEVLRVRDFFERTSEIYRGWDEDS